MEIETLKKQCSPKVNKYYSGYENNKEQYKKISWNNIFYNILKLLIVRRRKKYKIQNNYDKIRLNNMNMPKNTNK